ncbi:MAG: glycosyltransferase, partial [Dehalococcoidales bacterium]|nr:glycosyltransferase [Dehalococcoidales bacterium]
MNILVVHEVDWLKKVVFEIHNIAEQMSLLGHRVIAVDYEDTWQKNGFFDLGSLRARRFDAVSRTIADGPVTLRRPGIIRIPGISRLSAAFTHYREIQKIIKEEKIDVILLYSVPTNGLQTLYLAKRYGIPVVFRSIDILYRMVRYPVLRPATRFLERRVYANVDKIIAIAPRYASYVVGMGAPRERVKMVLMPVDTNLFCPTDESKELRAKWGLGADDELVVFIGTLFHFSGLDRFIRSFPQVLKDIPRAKLLIVGDGPQRPGLEAIIYELGLEKRVIITGFQPYETMPQ